MNRSLMLPLPVCTERIYTPGGNLTTSILTLLPYNCPDLVTSPDRLKILYGKDPV